MRALASHQCVPGSIPGPGRHMWVEFVVGSRPCSEGFSPGSPGSPVFLPPQKPTSLNSNSIGNSRTTALSVLHCCVAPSLNKVDLILILDKSMERSRVKPVKPFAGTESKMTV